jgi:hypothetical protein
MRHALRASPGLFIAVVLAATLAHSQERKPPAKASVDKEPAHSKLYRGFDPKSLLKTCEAHFSRLHGYGARSELRFGESPDRYKLFDVEGTITSDKLKGLITVLKADLHKMAKASGVEKVGEPSDKIEDRPIAVLRAMYAGRLIKPGTLRGFYLTYSDGKVSGAIDVIAGLNSNALDRWELACAVHEVVPE